MSSNWYLMSNQHLSGYEKEEIEKSYQVFDEILAQSPETYGVTVGTLTKKVIVQSTTDYSKRRLLFKENDINWGDLITHENEQWLVTERPFNNRIYEKSEMTLCNETLIIYGKAEQVYKGEDQLGRPIWETKQPPVYKYPCVVTEAHAMSADENEPLNLLDGNLVLQISYPSYPPLKYDQEFKMYGKTYRIVGLDERKVMGDKGVLLIVADKTT